MSGNSALSFNASFPPLGPNAFQSCYDYMYNCINSNVGTYAVNICTVTNLVIILPVCVTTLCLGAKQWRRRGQSRGMSNSDLFTYNLVLIELIYILGLTITFIGLQTNLNVLTALGIHTSPIIFCAHLLFHTLTCAGRYLAIVHPVTYLGLRTTKRTRIRNVTITFVWLSSFVTIGFIYFNFNTLIIIVSYCFVPAALIIMLYCSVSVLCTLIHPKPGEVGGVRQHADRTKLRAFCTITLILGVLLFRFGLNFLVAVLRASVRMGQMEQCGVLLSDLIFSPPCSLVLPLLLLHKAGKLKCCERKRKSGIRSV